MQKVIACIVIAVLQLAAMSFSGNETRSIIREQFWFDEEALDELLK